LFVEGHSRGIVAGRRSSEEKGNQLVTRGLEMRRDVIEDGRERAYTQCIMLGKRDVMLRWRRASSAPDTSRGSLKP